MLVLERNTHERHGASVDDSGERGDELLAAGRLRGDHLRHASHQLPDAVDGDGGGEPVGEALKALGDAGRVLLVVGARGGVVEELHDLPHPLRASHLELEGSRAALLEGLLLLLIGSAVGL